MLAPFRTSYKLEWFELSGEDLRAVRTLFRALSESNKGGGVRPILVEFLEIV